METMEHMMENKTQIVTLTYDQIKKLSDRFINLPTFWPQGENLSFETLFVIRQFNGKQTTIEYTDNFGNKRFFEL